MEINKIELKDLKVMAYDIMAGIQKLQNDLMNVNAIIAQKQSPSKTEKKEDKPKNKVS